MILLIILQMQWKKVVIRSTATNDTFIFSDEQGVQYRDIINKMVPSNSNQRTEINLEDYGSVDVCPLFTLRVLNQ